MNDWISKEHYYGYGRGCITGLHRRCICIFVWHCIAGFFLYIVRLHGVRGRGLWLLFLFMLETRVDMSNKQYGSLEQVLALVTEITWVFNRWFSKKNDSF